MGMGGGVAFFVLLSVVSTLAIGLQLVIILYLSEWTLRNAGYVEKDIRETGTSSSFYVWLRLLFLAAC